MRSVLFLLFIPGVFAYNHDRLHCPSTQEFSAEIISGEFKSPNFPNNYINNLNCVYEIHPLENYGVALNIEHFEIETLHDTVEIFQSYDHDGELYFTKHAVLSGSNIATNQFFSQINGGFRIVFKTDFSGSRFAGFKMMFNRFHQSATVGFNPCPQIFHMARSEIEELPLFGWQRSPRISCVFQINSTESIRLKLNYIKPSVKIDVFDAENFVGNGMGTALASYTKYSDKSAPNEIDSRTSSLIIIVSFMSTIANFTNAYNMTFQQVQNPCTCPQSLIKLNYSETFYTSPGWPDEYCDDIKCVTRFRGDFGIKPQKPDHFQCILVEFYNIEIEAIHDLFELYENNRKLKLLTPFDETLVNQISYFTFPSTNAIVNFTTDTSITKRGFRLSARLYDKPKQCRCPLQSSITDRSGQFVVNFDSACGYMDCFWYLTPPEDEIDRYRILLTIWYNVKSWSEFIEIGNDNQIGPSVKTIRLTPSMSAATELRDGKVISLHSDQPVEIWYHREDEEPEIYSGNRTFRFNYSWEPRCICGQLELKATDEWTGLNSPDYPAPYCENMNCSYIITAPEGSIIGINITQLDLEYNMDFLFVFDGPTTNYSRIDAFTGVEFTDDPLETTTNVALIRFTSDLSMSGKGFKLMYKAVKPKPEYSGSGFSVFKIFFLFAFVVMAAVGGVYVLKRYQPGLSLPAFPSFNLNAFDSQNLTSSLNAMLLRRNNNGDFVETE